MFLNKISKRIEKNKNFHFWKFPGMSTLKLCREVSFGYFCMQFSRIERGTCQEGHCVIKWKFNMFHVFALAYLTTGFLWPTLLFFHCFASHEREGVLRREHVCASWHFCMKFNAQRLLIKAFLDIMRTFGSVEAQSKTTLPFLNIIIFQWWQSLEAPSFTPGGDRRMHPLIFCTEFHAQQLLFGTFFI